MKILQWLDKNLERVVCVALLMVIALFTFINVVLRYVFKAGIPWATEGTMFLFAWCVWFAISYGFHMGSHANVTAVSNLLPAKGQKILAIICHLIMFAGMLYIAYWGARLVGDGSVKGKYGLLLHYPRWTLYLSTPVGASLSAIRILQNLIKLFRTPEESAAPQEVK